MSLSDSAISEWILEYLRARGLASTARCLEVETGLVVRDSTLVPELDLLRQLVIDGRWDDAVVYLEPFGRASARCAPLTLASALFVVRRQQLLELLDPATAAPIGTPGLPPEALFRRVLEALEASAPTRPDFLTLCHLMTLGAPTEHADFAAWTVGRGRAAVLSLVGGLALALLQGRAVAAPLVPPRFPRDPDQDSPATDTLSTLLWRAQLLRDAPLPLSASAFPVLKPLPPRSTGPPALPSPPPSPPPSLESRPRALQPPSVGKTDSLSALTPPPPAAKAGVSFGPPGDAGRFEDRATTGERRRTWGKPTEAVPWPQPADLTADALAAAATSAAAPDLSTASVGANVAASGNARVTHPHPRSAASAAPLPSALTGLINRTPSRGRDAASAPIPATDSAVRPPKAVQVQPPPAAPLPVARATEPYFPAYFVPGKQLFTPTTLVEDTQAVRTVAVHPSGRFVAVGANSQTLRVCSVGSRAHAPTICLQRKNYHRGSIYGCAWNARGTVLATCSNDKTIKLLGFDTQTWGEDSSKPGLEIRTNQGTVRDVIFHESPSGEEYVIAGGGGATNEVVLYSPATGAVVAGYPGHTNQIAALASCASHVVASASQDGTVRLWDVRAHAAVRVIQGPLGPDAGDGATAVAMPHHGHQHVCVGYESGQVMVYDTVAAKMRSLLAVHTSECRSLDISPDGKWLLTGSFDGTCALVAMRDFAHATPVARHADKIIRARWSPVEPVFVTCSADRTVALWSLNP